MPEFPYADLIAPLVISTMRAQASVVRHLLARESFAGFDYRQINSEYSWVVFHAREGKNRHLSEAPYGMFPLRNSHLRSKQGLPKALREAFEAKTFPRQSAVGARAYREYLRFVQEGPTRIASLVVNSFGSQPVFRASVRRGQPSSVHVKSALAIVYEYLTVPDMPGTRAYALMACRNYLFSEFGLIPGHSPTTSPNVFTVSDVEEALSHVRTSLRPRYLSKGEDKLPASGAGSVGGLIRQYLAMRDMLVPRYFSGKHCLDHLDEGQLVAAGKTVQTYEFAKSDYLEKLPDVGEVVNELWGLPLPLRGADTVFRGGLKFSGRQGLVLAIHGGPGAGKTSLALALAAHAAPFGIQTLFLTAEEFEGDLIERTIALVPETVRRLSFFPQNIDSNLQFTKFSLPGETPEALQDVQNALTLLASRLRKASECEASSGTSAIPKPCQAIVVLDGVHDLFANEVAGSPSARARLYKLVETLRDLKALVVVTTGDAWAGDRTLDYLVDVAMRLSHDTDDVTDKPDRRITLSKARHQLCAGGTHGLQISGAKGVRLSPQINYQLDQRAIWKARLPNDVLVRTAMRRVTSLDHLRRNASKAVFFNTRHSVDVFDGAHIFINGRGSGGKAALALKLAVSPIAARSSDLQVDKNEKVLVVSFLYPKEYYQHLHLRLHGLHALEYRGGEIRRRTARMEVIHLYPGHLRPHELYNRIEWELQAAELSGDAYSAVIIDGIHNVFLQFPEIEKYRLFWPQIYSALRSRNITTITTHTTLALPFAGDEGSRHYVDDNRSEPLRHALVQKTDFQFEVDPWLASPFSRRFGELSREQTSALSDLFVLKVASAIGQRIPQGFLLWSREDLLLFDPPDGPTAPMTDVSYPNAEGKDQIIGVDI
jgi:hypothetical protein